MSRMGLRFPAVVRLLVLGFVTILVAVACSDQEQGFDEVRRAEGTVIDSDPADEAQGDGVDHAQAAGDDETEDPGREGHARDGSQDFSADVPDPDEIGPNTVWWNGESFSRNSSSCDTDPEWEHNTAVIHDMLMPPTGQPPYIELREESRGEGVAWLGVAMPDDWQGGRFVDHSMGIAEDETFEVVPGEYALGRLRIIEGWPEEVPPGPEDPFIVFSIAC